MLTVPVSSLSPAQKSLFRQGYDNHVNAASGPEKSFLQDGQQRLDAASLGFWTVNSNGLQMLYMTIRFPGVPRSSDFGVIVAPDSTLAKRRGQAPKSPSPANLAREDRATPMAPEEQRLVSLAINEADYAAAVLAIGQAARINVVADAFTLTERLTAYPKQRPLRDSLDRLAGAFGAEWRWARGALLIRSDAWEQRLDEEPTAAVLDRMTAAVRKNPFLPASELAYAARYLNREQLKGLGRWRDARCNLAAEAARIRHSYALFAWAGLLDEANWNTLMGPGISISALSPRQRTVLAGLARGSSGEVDLSGVNSVRWREGRTKYPPEILLELRDNRGRVVSDLR